MTAQAGVQQAGATPGSRVRHLVLAAAAPVIGAVTLIGLLSMWVITGGAGTISRVRIEVTFAAIPMSSFAASAGVSGTTGTYLTIRNLSGSADELTGASSPAARRVILIRPGAGTGTGHSPGPVAGAGPPAAGLTIPAHSVVALSPLGRDVLLTGGTRLRAGQRVPLTLVFRQAGRITVEATVTTPGAP